MVEALNRAPLFIYRPLKAPHQHSRQDRVYQGGQEVYVIRNIYLDNFVRLAARGRIDLDLVEAELLRVRGGGKRQAHEAAQSSGYNTGGACYVSARAVALLIARNGEAHRLASSIVYCDLGLDEARYVNDAEYEQEQKGRCQGKLDDALAYAPTASPPEKGQASPPRLGLASFGLWLFLHYTRPR